MKTCNFTNLLAGIHFYGLWGYCEISRVGSSVKRDNWIISGQQMCLFQLTFNKIDQALIYIVGKRFWVFRNVF